MSSRFVRPETVRLELSGGDWIRVKKRLNAGEHIELFNASIKKYDLENKPVIDSPAAARALLEAYLLDWNFEDENGPVEIRGLATEELRGVLANLDFETLTELTDAIVLHDAAAREAGAALKKTRTSARESLPISESLAGVAGGTNG